MDDVRIILADLPCAVGAFTVRRDGFYTIVVNARSSAAQQRESVAHERRHIESGDFDRSIPADSIEGMRHESRANPLGEMEVSPR